MWRTIWLMPASLTDTKRSQLLVSAITVAPFGHEVPVDRPSSGDHGRERGRLIVNRTVEIGVLGSDRFPDLRPQVDHHRAGSARARGTGTAYAKQASAASPGRRCPTHASVRGSALPDPGNEPRFHPRQVRGVTRQLVGQRPLL